MSSRGSSEAERLLPMQNPASYGQELTRLPDSKDSNNQGHVISIGRDQRGDEKTNGNANNPNPAWDTFQEIRRRIPDDKTNRLPNVKKPRSRDHHVTAVLGFWVAPNDGNLEWYQNYGLAVGYAITFGIIPKAIKNLECAKINAESLKQLYPEIETLREAVINLRKVIVSDSNNAIDEEQNPFQDRCNLTDANRTKYYAAGLLAPVAGGVLGYTTLPAISASKAIIGGILGAGFWGCFTNCRRGKKVTDQELEIIELKRNRENLENEFIRLFEILENQLQHSSVQRRLTINSY